MAPWIFAASSLARKVTAAATSSGVVIRREGMRASIGPTCSANSAARSVEIGPGATALTRTPDGPYSSAQDLVNEWRIALLPEYTADPAAPRRPVFEPMLTTAP